MNRFEPVRFKVVKNLIQLTILNFTTMIESDLLLPMKEIILIKQALNPVPKLHTNIQQENLPQSNNSDLEPCLAY